MNEAPVRVIKETLLSRAPARGSLWMALGSLGAAILVSATYWLDLRGVASALPATAESVFEKGEYWRLITTMGVHADPRHLVANGIALGVLSFLLYGYFGLVVHPILTLTLGAIATGLALRTYPPGVGLLGASGLVYLMAGFWLTLYLLVERRLHVGKRLLRALGFGLIVLVPTVWDPSVSYRTHAIGFFAGVAFGVVYFSKKKQDIRKLERVEWG